MATAHETEHPGTPAVEMPEATIWPLVLAVGVTLFATGLATSWGLVYVGVVLMIAGLSGWIGSLLPGRGHIHETLAEPGQRAKPIAGLTGTVAHLQPGMIGYRFRLPTNVHPISAGVKGGIVGGIIMPIPALIYGLISGQGLWFPINLLAGMVLPGLNEVPLEELQKFNLTWFILAGLIHVTFSIGFGLMYGVVLPTLPTFQGNWLIYGAVLMPVIWSGMAYAFMGVVNPLLDQYVEWRWFFVTQGVFGLAMSFVVNQQEKIPVAPAGSGVEEPAFPEEPKP